METGTKGPPLRLEHLPAYLDDKLEHESQVLDLLIVAQARGQGHQELWDKLHSAALRDDRLTELAFAYEKLNQDRRVRIMAPQNQAQIFMNAARFFMRALGDVDGAQAALERALSLVPGHADAFDQLRKILEEKGERDKLIDMHLAAVGPKTDKEVALEHLRAALAIAVEKDADRASKIGQQILKLSPSDHEALSAICVSLETARKFPELARTLEQAVAADPPAPEDKRLAMRIRLLELYDDKVPEIERAAPHVEEVLAHDKDNASARRVASRLLTNKAAAPRAAAALEKVYEIEGDRGGVAQMLATQIEHLRGPKRAEAQRRLGMIQFEEGDGANAFSNFEAVLSVDPADEEVRVKYVELARHLGRGADASKMLSRAAAAVKSPQMRARINLDAARFMAEQGDPKRARVILQGVLDLADGDVALEAARTLRSLAPEPKALAPILEAISKSTEDQTEKLEVLRELAALYETSLDDLASAIQARKRVLEIDHTAEPEELERLLEARKDWGTLAEVLEIRARSMSKGDDQRNMLVRAAALRAEEVGDHENAKRALTSIRADFGPARDVHSLLLPLLERSEDHEALIDVLTTEIDLAEEEERSALITRLSESLLATARIDDALDALAEVIAVRSDQPRARERLLQLMRGWTPPGAAATEEGERTARLRAAQILAPVHRFEDDGTSLVESLEVIADLDPEPQARLGALAEAHARIDAIGKDKVRALFLAGRGLREAVTHDVAQLPDWLERIGQSETGPSKAAVAETLATALRDREVDHPHIARLAQRTGEAYAAAGDLNRAIESYRRVLELEPDNEEIIERIDHLLAEKGSPDERIQLYRSALDRPGSDDRKRRLYLAIGGVQRDDLDQIGNSIETYRSGLALLPGDLHLREALLDALEHANRHAELYDELLADRAETGSDVATAELDLRLADVAVKKGEPADAARHYRDALAVDGLTVGPDTLEIVDDLARERVDVPLLVAVAERRVTIAEPGPAKTTMLEQLGALVGDRGGDPARAAGCFLEAGEQALSQGDTQRAAADFERVLAYQPETRLALERLLGIHAEAADKARLLETAARLMRLIEDREEALDLLGQLADVVTEADANADDMGRLTAIVDALEEKFGRSMPIVHARTRILLSAGRIVEAAEGLAALLGEHELREDAAGLLREVLERHVGEDLFPVQRTLLEHGIAIAAPPDVRARRLELLYFERDLAKDAGRAAAVLDALLEADPRDEDALLARQRLAADAGDYETAAKCLERRLEVAADDETRAMRAAELARLKFGTMKDIGGALDAVEPLIEYRAQDPVLREVALPALGDPDHGPRAAALLVRLAEGMQGARERAAIYAALFERANASADPSRVVPDPPALYRAWLDALEEDPPAALEVAARAATRAPEDESFWDKAEELARGQNAPDRVAKAYRDVLAVASTLAEDVTMRVGERGVAFHEEWFDDPEVVTGMLRQVVEAAPAATWAFERLKLVYNAAERWQELFDLYDRVIAAQPDAEGRQMILEDAVEVARDLAADQDRAVQYLEQLFGLRPRDAKIEAQLERLYERQSKSRALIQLLDGRLSRLDPEEARATRFRMAGLWETAESDLSSALGAVRPLVESSDEEAAQLVEGWLERTAPVMVGIIRGRYRALARLAPPADPVRAPAARLLEPYYANRGEQEKAASMLEVLLEVETDREERLKLVRSLQVRRSGFGNQAGALEATMAEVALLADEADEKTAIDAALLAAGSDKELLGRAVDVLREVGEDAEDKTRSLRLLRRASAIARDDLKDDARSITLDLAILSRSDEDPAGARAAARKLDRDLKAAGREADRCAVLERLAILEDSADERRVALLEAARIAEEQIGDRERAVRNLQKWLEEVPGDVPVLTMLVANLRALGDSGALVGALEARSNATKSDEEAESDRIEIARLYARVLEDSAKAVEAYRLAIKKHGSSDELVDELAHALESDGRNDELAELLRTEAGRKKPKDRKSKLFARLGEVEQRRGQLAPSLEAFVSALKLVSSSADAQRGLQSLIDALSPTDPATQPIFAQGVETLAASFEQAGQMDQWLATVPQLLLAYKTDGERCELLLRAARLEEEVGSNEVRALERTVQAFVLRPQLPGVAQALLERARKTSRWDLVAPALLPPLATRDDIPSAVARDLLVDAAAWASGEAVPGAPSPLAEALLAAAHARVPQDEDVLDRLVALRRETRGAALVEALVALAALRRSDIDLLREALTIVLRELHDEDAVGTIAEQILARATERLDGKGPGDDDAAEDALAWAIEILEPIWTEESGAGDRLKDMYLAAAALPLRPERVRNYLVFAARLSRADEAISINERLYAAEPDAEVAAELVRLYGQLDRKADLARLYGHMADGAANPEERARLRLLQAELFVALNGQDQAISVLRQAIGEVGIHEPSVDLLSSLLEKKGAYSELCALFESQADLSKRADPVRAQALYRRASDLAEAQLKDVQRAARSFRRVAELDPSAESLDRFASLLERARLFDEEAQVLERLMELHGRQDELSLRLAAAYGHAGHVERAREELERAIAAGGASPRVREVLASIYRGAGAWESLAELYETEAGEAPDETGKVARLRDAAQVYIVELARPGDAVRLLEHAASLKPDDLDAMLVLSSALRAAGRLDDARARLGRLMEEFGTRKPKERALVHFELARVALVAKDRALALTELEAASKIDPAHAGVLQLLGEIALEEGQFLRAQRTYRGLLLVLRSQRGGPPAGASTEGFFAPPTVHKSQVFVELAFIAERQKDADRKAEFVESAFEAARESIAESDALVVALEKRGYFDLVARALDARLEASDLPVEQRSAIELRVAEIYGRKLDRADDAAAIAIRTFTRALDAEAQGASPTEERVAGLLRDLGKIDLMYDALRERSTTVLSEERARLLARAATIAEAYLHDDAKAAEALEGLIEAWSESGAATQEERAATLHRLDNFVSRLVASGASPLERHAKVLEQVVDMAASQGMTFTSAPDAFYRLLEIYVVGAHVDAAYGLLERALRDDQDGDRVEPKLRDAMGRCPGDNRFVRLLEDFGRDRGRGRAVVDALETLAGRATDPAGHLREAYEASLDLEDPSLTERLLRRLVPNDPSTDNADTVWAITELAERRFSASDAREAADLWERAAKVSDPDEERSLLLRVADLSDRVLGDTDRAIKIYESLRQHEPADREIWSPLADIHSRRGDTEALAQLMDETIPLVDDLKERAKLRFSLAKLLEVTDPDRAADVLTEAVDEDPTNRDSATLLERLYEATGRDDKLAILLERQLDFAKDEDDKQHVVALYLRIGMLRERLKDQDAAIDAYHGALDWDENNLSALRAAVRLHTEREDSLVMGDLLDRLLELESGDEAAAIALKVADVKLSSGDTVGAERALYLGFKANPRSGELRQRLVDLYNERGDRVGLARVSSAEARLLTDPAARRAAILEAAEIIKDEGDPREASDVYAEALDIEPTDRDTLFFFMETCANSGQHQRAIEAVNRVLAVEPGDPWLLFSRAVLREAVAESDAALDDLEGAFDKSGGQYANELRAHLEAALVRIQRDPSASKRSEGDLRLRLAEVSAAGGDVESARVVVEELLQQDPQSPAALAALGKIEELAGRVDIAAMTYARAVAYSSGPEVVGIALRLYEASRRIGRADLCRAGLEKALRAHPDEAELRAALRVVYEETGALLELSDLVVDEAQKAATPEIGYEKLLEAARLLLYGSGEVSTGPAMAERALAVLEEARSIKPGEQDLLQLTSEALAALGRGEEARGVLAQMIASHRGRRSRELGQLFYSLYRVESKGGNLSEALEALTKAHDNQPQNGALALELGQLAMDLDEQDIAQRAFRSVTLLKTDGSTGVTPQERAVAYYHLGSIAHRQGDARRAKLMLEKSLAEDPSIQAARQLLGQLG